MCTKSVCGAMKQGHLDFASILHTGVELILEQPFTGIILAITTHVHH